MFPGSVTPLATRFLNQTLGDGPFYVVVRWFHDDDGMAHLFLGEERETRDRVIIKIPNRQKVVDDAVWQQAFEREIQALRYLNHPGIVRLLHNGVFDGLPYLVLRFLEGGNLLSRLKTGLQGQQEPQRPEPLLTWLPRVAQCLDFIHNQGFVHLDLKPDSIYFDEAGNPLLGDFGSCRALSTTLGSDAGDLSSLWQGTPPYMAPEQILGQAPTTQTDQFALAVIVYEWLAGSRPFVGDSHDEITRAHEQPATPLSQRRFGVPTAISLVLAKALSVDPWARYPTCSAFADQLRAAIAPMISNAAPGVTHSVDDGDTFAVPISETEFETAPSPRVPTEGKPYSPTGVTEPIPPQGTSWFRRLVLLGTFFFLVLLGAGVAAKFALPEPIWEEWVTQPWSVLWKKLESPGLDSKGDLAKVDPKPAETKKDGSSTTTTAVVATPTDPGDLRIRAAGKKQLYQTVIVTQPTELLVAPGPGNGVAVDAMSTFLQLKTDDGNEEKNGFIRVGTSIGEPLGWLKKDHVSDWNTRFGLVPRSGPTLPVFSDPELKTKLADVPSAVIVGQKQVGKEIVYMVSAAQAAGKKEAGATVGWAGSTNVVAVMLAKEEVEQMRNSLGFLRGEFTRLKASRTVQKMAPLVKSLHSAVVIAVSGQTHEPNAKMEELIADLPVHLRSLTLTPQMLASMSEEDYSSWLKSLAASRDKLERIEKWIEVRNGRETPAEFTWFPLLDLP